MSVTVTTIHNPFNELANTIEVMDYRAGSSLLHYLPELANRDGVSWVVAVNGRVIEAAFEDVIIQDGDIIAVSAKVNGMMAAAIATWATGAATASAALTAGIGTFLAYTAVYAVGMLVIGYGMSMLASALAPKPTTGGTAGTDVEQTYGWNDLAPSLSEGNPIPLMYGINKVAGQVINEFVEVKGNDQHLYSLMALCDHEVDAIADIRINNQPSAYYQDVTTDTRLGTFADTLVDGFNEIVEQKNYGDVLDKDVEVIKQTDGNAVEKINIHIVAPQGLYYSNNDGGLDQRTAEFNIKYRVVGAASWTLLGSYAITDNTTETIRKTYTIDDLTPEQYEVQVTRTNPEESSFRGSSEIQLYAVQEVVKEKLTYPGLAKYAVKALATGQLSGARPVYTCLVTRNTVPVHNNGTDWTTGSATNPAWICYNIVNQRVPYTRIIYSEFLAWANHCDEDISAEGDPAEKRFVLDVVVNQNKGLWDQVQEIARYADAAVVRKGTRYGVFVDKADTVVSHLFTMGNINKDSFSIQYLPQKDRANAVEIEYTDPDRAYSRQVVMLMSSDYNDPDSYSKKASVRVDGAIPYNQAVRMGIRQINNNRYINRVVTFEADIDSFACTIGDLFYFAHETVDYERGVSGRIPSATAGTVTLDRPVVIASGVNYSILVRIQDDTIVEKTVTNAAGTTSVLTLSSNFATTPDPYSVYAFGVATTVKKIYRLINLTKANDFTRQITGIEYIGDIYTEGDDIIIENPPWVEPVQEALNVRLKEILVWGNDGTYASSIHVSWHPSHREQGKKWAVWLKDTDTSQAAMKAAVVSSLHTVIGSQFLTIGHTYRITICPDGDGLYETTGDNTNYEDITLLGKLAPPSDVTNFIGIWNSLVRAVNLSWTHISDIDFDHYEIRQKTTGTPGWDAAVVVAKTIDNAKSLPVDNNTAETLTYYIKAVDTSGIYSETEDEAQVPVDTSETPLSVPTGLTVTSSSSFTESGEQIVTMEITWDEDLSDDFHHYNIMIERQLGTNEAGNAMNPVSGFTTDVPRYSYIALPATRYWVAVRSVDTNAGRTAWCSQVEHVTVGDTEAPPTPVWSDLLSIVPGFKLIGLKWEDVDADDLAHYVVARSETGDFTGEETEIGNIAASFVTDTGLEVDTEYFYRVKAVDTSGNSSGWSTIKNATTLLVGSTDIAYNAILANHIFVANLSAINANMGTIIAGIIQNAAENPTSWMDLANQTMSLGGKLTWDGVSLLLNGWNSVTDSTKIDGGYIHAGSRIKIGDMDGVSDRCIITDGEIYFDRYFGPVIGHRQVRSLKQITYGSCSNAVAVELPGYWAEKPIVHVSPKRMKTYSANPLHTPYDQSIDCPDPEVYAISDGVYGFTPKAELILSDGATNALIGSATYADNNWEPEVGTHYATTVEYVFSEANVVYASLVIDCSGYYLHRYINGNADRGWIISRHKYEIKVTVETRYYTSGVWTDWDDNSEDPRFLVGGVGTFGRAFQSATAIEKIEARVIFVATSAYPNWYYQSDPNVALYAYATLPSEETSTDPTSDPSESLLAVQITSYQTNLAGFSALATGTLNYIAIESAGHSNAGSDDLAGTLTLIVGNPEEQIERSGYKSVDPADEADSVGMVDGDIWIQYED